MSWKPIVAAVDMSPEGTRAAVFASRFAETARTECHLVHAVHDPWTDAPLAEMPKDLAQINEILLDSARLEIQRRLAGQIPARILEDLQVRFGPTWPVLDDEIGARNAELLVLGGKHHSTLGRWLGGSTVHQVVRGSGVPVLITGLSATGIRRVLAPVDLSRAAGPTIQMAERIAGLFDAELRFLHVVRPMPLTPGFPATLTAQELLHLSEAALEDTVWPLVSRDDAEQMIRRGQPADTIATVATDWSADLVVVGSHGRGRVDRVLIGSVTERLLSRLPTSLLVVPVSASAERRPERRQVRLPRRRAARTWN